MSTSRDQFAHLTPVIVDVEIKPAEDIDDPSKTMGLSVNTVWATAEGIALDRPNVGGWVVKDQRMADRLAAAIRAGVVYTDAHVRADVNGRTYVGATARVLGRYLNADLKRLGY